jgi:hypothetical protein
MEVIANNAGAWLVEVGARLAGGFQATACNDLHGGRLDVFDIALQGYLFSKPLADPSPDWAHYNSVNFVIASGVAKERALVYSLSGVEEVERRPEFLRWVSKPSVASLVCPTVDMFTHPFIVQLLSPNRACDVELLADWVRAIVRWNEKPSLRLKASADLRAQAQRLARRLEWLAAERHIAELVSRRAALKPWRPTSETEA